MFADKIKNIPPLGDVTPWYNESNWYTEIDIINSLRLLNYSNH